MENEESWNTFARTGKVTDYLNYTGSSYAGENSAGNGMREERGQRERASDGNGTLSGYHW